MCTKNVLQDYNDCTKCESNKYKEFGIKRVYKKGTKSTQKCVQVCTKTVQKRLYKVYKKLFI